MLRAPRGPVLHRLLDTVFAEYALTGRKRCVEQGIRLAL